MEPRLIDSSLPSQSLTDREVIQFSHTDREVRMVPDANVLKLGGQSIMDRGRAAVYPASVAARGLVTPTRSPWTWTCRPA
jgi:hypothetical protein